MPAWGDVLNEINSINGFDFVRRKYLAELYEETGRNVIAYYSGWQTKGYTPDITISDSDRDGFMQAVHKLDAKEGLDLILHTPGGSIAAAHTIIDYLKDKFDRNIRVIVPHTAMSAGTVIACAAKVILMGKHSALGPIDPQIAGMPANGVLNEIKKAHEELRDDPTKMAVWGPILSKYQPTFIGQCEQAIKWSEKFTRDLLKDNMFFEDEDRENKIDKVISDLTDYENVMLHERQIRHDEAKDIGLKIDMLEDNDNLQDLVLTIHHCFTHALANTPTYKIIENHIGASFMRTRMG